MPVGRYTKEALESAGLWDAVKGKSLNTQNVRQSLDYVARGEADAGFVYVTDATIMPDKVDSTVRGADQDADPVSDCRSEGRR